MINIETANNAADNLIEVIESLQNEIDALKAELKQLEKSDASKEQSSIDYYGLYRELKNENLELKNCIVEITKGRFNYKTLVQKAVNYDVLKSENKALKERLEKATKAFYELLNKYENGDREVNPIDYYYKKAVESDKENKEND